MNLIEWNDTYELGVKVIDEHHRKLIELLNCSYDILLCSGDKAGMKTILKELADYTNYHFDFEERLMAEVGYRGLGPHALKHNSFREQVSALMQDHLSRSPNVNTDIVLFLCDWLKKHILKEDRKFTIYLSRSGQYQKRAGKAGPERPGEEGAHAGEQC
jgi:hemerythrin-like metal-binding protein